MENDPKPKTVFHVAVKPLVAMEATGMYWNALNDELTRRGYHCAVLNPIQTNFREQKTHPQNENRPHRLRSDRPNDSRRRCPGEP